MPSNPLLEDGHDDLQIAFFCDIFEGSSAADVHKLQDLIDRFPDNVATDGFQPKDEMLVAAGVDGALMASYFEPFGYAPIWVGMQGGFIVTAANGGQIDIFDPDTTFFIDIRPDIDKPRDLRSARWDDLRARLFVTNDDYRRRIFKHNTNAIRQGIVAAKTAFRDSEKARAIRAVTMRRMFDLANGEDFTRRIEAEILGIAQDRPLNPDRPSHDPRYANRPPAATQTGLHVIADDSRRADQRSRA